MYVNCNTGHNFSKKYSIALLLSLCVFIFFSSSPALRCSNVGISGNGYTATARTLDFPVNSGNIFGLGKVGDENTTDITVLHGDKDTDQKVKALTWTTEHNFLGQTWQGGLAIIDGVNDEGLYAAYLYLSHFTEYPKYNPGDPRPAVGIMDVADYLLGTADSVSDALERLKRVQVIISAIPMNPSKRDGVFVAWPVHMVLRDREGNAAVVEWVKGEQVIYPDSGPVITNTPSFRWQMLHAQRYDYVTSEITAAKYDGVRVDGTGFAGIPGDWSSPSRFARSYQMAKHSPKPNSSDAALRTALSILDSVVKPMGTSLSPTLWKSMIDLDNSVYCFQPMFDVIDLKKNEWVAYNPATSWVVVDLNKVVLEGTLPKGWVRVIPAPTPKGAAKKLIDLIKRPEGWVGLH